MYKWTKGTLPNWLYFEKIDYTKNKNGFIIAGGCNQRSGLCLKCKRRQQQKTLLLCNLKKNNINSNHGGELIDKRNPEIIFPFPRLKNWIYQASFLMARHMMPKKSLFLSCIESTIIWFYNNHNMIPVKAKFLEHRVTWFMLECLAKKGNWMTTATVRITEAQGPNPQSAANYQLPHLYQQLVHIPSKQGRCNYELLSGAIHWKSLR